MENSRELCRLSSGTKIKIMVQGHNTNHSRNSQSSTIFSYSSSFLISMLSYYLDINQSKERFLYHFKNLNACKQFGDSPIGSRSYYIIVFSFLGLDSGSTHITISEHMMNVASKFFEHYNMAPARWSDRSISGILETIKTAVPKDGSLFILVDEYDCSVNRLLENLNTTDFSAIEGLGELKHFFTCLKDMQSSSSLIDRVYRVHVFFYWRLLD